MTNFKHHVAKAGMLLLLIGMLSACGNVSRGVASDGQRAEALVWPDVNAATPMHKGGTFPNVDNLRQVRPGLNKQQVANLIGFPHFSEGVWGVREWNYVFNFRQGADDTVATCQFKILFDENRLARSFYWHPESCAPDRKPASVAAAVEEAPLKDDRLTLSSDTLFAFDGASVADITDGGKADLDRLVHTIKARERGVHDIHIIGFTDRLGSDGYNEDLSQKRAFAVMNYLVAHGIPSELIEAEGRGKMDAVKVCPPSDLRSLIACLAPNRRVVVVINGADSEPSGKARSS